MPCTDGRDAPGYSSGYSDGASESRAAKQQIKLLEAMLCAALTVLDKHKLGKEIDYQEGGFTNAQLQHWWANHHRQDQIRREREAKIAADKAEKQRILNKLTPAERKKVGL